MAGFISCVGPACEACARCDAHRKKYCGVRFKVLVRREGHTGIKVRLGADGGQARSVVEANSEQADVL